MSKPAGLARFKRSMTTKFNGRCIFCDAATSAGVDHAFLNTAGKWLASCATCSTSHVEQVKGVVRSIAVIDLTGVDTTTVLPFDQALLTRVLQGQANDGETLAMLRTMVSVRRSVRHSPCLPPRSPPRRSPRSPPACTWSVPTASGRRSGWSARVAAQATATPCASPPLPARAGSSSGSTSRAASRRAPRSSGHGRRGRCPGSPDAPLLFLCP